jgi:surface polysaccharide O-acyltransferase-like enzyme
MKLKIINDTLKEPNEKWSRKSLTAFVAFSAALTYEFVLPFISHKKGFEFSHNQYVFEGLLLLTAATLGLTVWDKVKNNTEDGN